MAAVGVEDMLEVGSLHVGLIAVRDVKRVKQGGVSDMLGLSPQASPYCRFTLGVSLLFWSRSPTAVHGYMLGKRRVSNSNRHFGKQNPVHMYVAGI